MPEGSQRVYPVTTPPCALAFSRLAFLQLRRKMHDNLHMRIRLRIASRNANSDRPFRRARMELRSFHLLNEAGIPYTQFVFASRRPGNFQRKLISPSRPRFRKNPQSSARAAERRQNRLLAQSKLIEKANPQ